MNPGLQNLRAIDLGAQTTLLAILESVADLRVVLLLAGTVFLGLFFLTRARQRSVRSMQDGQLTARERVEKMMPPRGVGMQMSELMAQLADLSREINGQIDTRIARLELLLHRADETLARLEDRAQVPAGQEVTPDPPLPADGTATLIRQLRQQLADPTEPLAIREKASDKPTPGAGQQQRILELARGGSRPVEIARELNRPVGEIELVLSLAGQNSCDPDKNP